MGEFVQLLLERQQYRAHHRHDDRGAGIEERHSAQQEGQDHGDLCGKAEVRLNGGRPVIGDAQQPHDREQHNAEEEVAVLGKCQLRICCHPNRIGREVRRNPPRKPGQPKGPQARELDVGHLLLGDLPLEANDQANRKGNK